MFEYNFWDDRTMEEYYSESNHPCYGCRDFFDGQCISNGGCASSRVEEINDLEDDNYD